MATLCCGFSFLYCGEPIVKEPDGITIISGQSRHSRNLVPGALAAVEPSASAPRVTLLAAVEHPKMRPPAVTQRIEYTKTLSPTLNFIVVLPLAAQMAPCISDSHSIKGKGVSIGGEHT